ncbi:hypothetical protein evm_002453 [Chilo suppressalis]|nr:hypothetical protein evm_002453 [Chilo suppressalis]
MMWLNWMIFGAYLALSDAEPCETPLGQISECVPINQCREVVYRISNGLDQQSLEFLRQSRCRSSFQNPRICCGPFPDDVYNREYSNSIQPSYTEYFDEDSVLPERNQCGFEPLSDGDRIISGSRTEIGEFPWLALLWYRKHLNGALGHKCGGMLINHRHVLTAAHCVTGRELAKYGKLVSVTLGEHDVRNTTDCIDGVCSAPPQTVEVLNVYPHPGYIDERFIRQNDIGLIRLERRVEYTDYIQPICLDKSGLWEIGDEIFVAGWGSTLQAGRSPEKLKVSLPIANQLECSQRYRSSFRINLSDSQICIGGKFLKDACHGDSGSPAMRQRDGRWEAVGLVSFGYGCGRENWPGIYSVVSSHRHWIEETLKLASRDAPQYATGNFASRRFSPTFAPSEY